MKGIHTGSAIAIIAAVAVAASAYAAPLETVTVTGSRALTEKSVGQTMHGVPVKEVSLSYTVKVADLDPGTAAGKAEIQKRVTEAAKAACKEIERLAMGNPTSPGEAACVKNAVDEAMAKIK